MAIKIGMKYTPAASGGAGKVMRKAFKAAFEDAKPQITALIIERASAEARRTLRSRAAAYVNALKQADAVSLTETRVEVTLDSKIARSIESGAPPWDMKPALLKRATRSSNGGTPYVDVPISSSGAQGIRKAATKKPTLAAKVKGVGKAVVRALKGLPARARVGKAVVQKRKGLPTRAKVSKGYKPIKPPRSGKSMASTVRRVSANSSPSSWWHPGFKPAGILKKTIAQLKPEILDIINSSLAKGTK